MNKGQHITLKLSERFKNRVSSRAAVINLFDIDFSNVLTIDVDFNDIVFISRSATHQFIKEKQRLEKESQFRVKFFNLNTEVKAMFDIVNKSIATPQPKVSEIHRVHFSTQKEFSSFLLRI